MTPWELFRKSFDVWEDATARYLEHVLRSPLVLTPAGAALTATMKAKTAWEKQLAESWGAFGLATRRDQLRAMHALNQLQSRLLDLEEALDESTGSGADDRPAESPAPRNRAAKVTRLPARRTRRTSRARADAEE